MTKPLNPAAFEEVRGLKARYFRYIDTKRWDALLELFVEDCAFDGLWAAAATPTDFVDTLRRNLDGIGVITVHQEFMPELTQAEDNTIRGIWAMYDYLRWQPRTA